MCSKIFFYVVYCLVSWNVILTTYTNNFTFFFKKLKMVLGLTPVCCKCKATECPIWHKENDQIYCTDCKTSLNKQKQINNNDGSDNDRDDQCGSAKEDKNVDEEMKDIDESSTKEKKDDEDKKETKRKTRKGGKGGKGSIPKGKGRRCIFKKSVSFF